MNDVDDGRLESRFFAGLGRSLVVAEAAKATATCIAFVCCFLEAKDMTSINEPWREVNATGSKRRAVVKRSVQFRSSCD